MTCKRCGMSDFHNKGVTECRGCGDPVVRDHLDELAKEYTRTYEIIHMNADTPRLSGREYLEHGFKAGYAARQAEIDELKREIEYLRRYGNKDCTGMADEALAEVAKIMGEEG